MGLLGLVWRIYNELLKLVGNFVLVIAGIAACAFATVRQYDPVHSTQENTLIFFVGIAVVISSWVRRLIWMTFGLTVPWALLVVGLTYVLTVNPARFQVSPVLVLLALAPPAVAAFVLALLPKPPAVGEKTTLLPSVES